MFASSGGNFAYIAAASAPLSGGYPTQPTALTSHSYFVRFVIFGADVRLSSGTQGLLLEQ